MLVVEDLHTSYGAIAALRGISFAVRRGTVVALIGANGAGKSTTLNTISGLLVPLRSAVRFEGRAVTDWRADRVAGLGLVQVPEGRQVLGPLSVEEDLLLGAYSAATARSAPTWSGPTPASRAWRSGGASSPAASPAGSSRCWRLGGR